MEKIEWPVRWRWQRPLAVLLFTAAMLLLSAWVPVSEGAAVKKRIIEKPSAVKDVEQWVQELRKEQAVEEKSAEEVDKKIADLLKRPAENWYEHGSLEAAGNLKEQTAAELRELAENLADAQRAASALQAMGDSAPQAVKDSLAAGLEQAASNLAAGGMKPNEQLLQQLQNMKPSDLKGLSKEQMQKLAEQLKQNSETLGKCLGQLPGLRYLGHPDRTTWRDGKEGKNGKDGDGDPGRAASIAGAATRNCSSSRTKPTSRRRRPKRFPPARCRSRRARRRARRDRREARSGQERLPGPEAGRRHPERRRRRQRRVAELAHARGAGGLKEVFQMIQASHLTESEAATAAESISRLRIALQSVLFGQDELIDHVITGLLARGHMLLEGLPGLGKTELVKGLAKALGLQAKRIQFTPDLLPGDITGNPMLQEVGWHAAASSSSRGRSSPTSCWRTKSTAPRPRRSPRCSRPCRSAASP